MIERESTGDGWQVRIVPTPGQRLVRLIPAAFLCVWLCGWALGEYFAGGALATLVAERWAPGAALGLLPRFHGPSGDMALPVMGFLALWVTGWTIGGVAAFSQLLSLLFGVPVLRWSAAGVVLDTRVGPFATHRRLTWDKAEALLGGAAATRDEPVPASPQAATVTSAVRSFVGLGLEDADRETLLGWLREARTAPATAATGEPEQYRAIG
jgi:hypothetical protein